MTPRGARHGLAERLLTAATLEGDRALGGEGRGIAAGGLADLVAVDLRRPAAAGVPPLEAAAFIARPEWVSDSWVGGVPVIVDGHHANSDAIVAAAQPYLGGPSEQQFLNNMRRG
jgi:cytosine/adenosine deaminase-related metal-dependent hydrolase